MASYTAKETARNEVKKSIKNSEFIQSNGSILKQQVVKRLRNMTDTFTCYNHMSGKFTKKQIVMGDMVLYAVNVCSVRVALIG